MNVNRVCYWQCTRCGRMVEEDHNDLNPRYVITMTADRGKYSTREVRTLYLCSHCGDEFDKLARNPNMVAAMPMTREGTK